MAPRRSLRKSASRRGPETAATLFMGEDSYEVRVRRYMQDQPSTLVLLGGRGGSELPPRRGAAGAGSKSGPIGGTEPRPASNRARAKQGPNWGSRRSWSR